MPLPDIAQTERQVPTRIWRGQAMASLIEVQMISRGPAAEVAAQRALKVFNRVDDACTRFRPSPLTAANEDPTRWHRVPPLVFKALRESYSAYQETGGLFDPRVHDDLVELGYDRSFSLGLGPVTGPEGGRAPLDPWKPRFVSALRLVRVGDRKVDLGGIGKGLAVRWAAEELLRADGNFCINAGGDCYLSGRPSPGAAWRVGVEDPAGAEQPVAVLEAVDLAVATSSVRIRRWKHGERTVHHIIDPRTGRPGGGELAAVTVLNPDPARAEIWSKVCFLSGSEHVGEIADREALPVLWVTESGAVGMSRDMRRHVIWTRD